MIVDLPIHGNFKQHPPYTPIDVPVDMLKKLDKLHTSPALWYMSQFFMYMMRPKKALQDKIDNFLSETDGPLVG